WAPLVGKFARFNLPALVAARRIEYDVAANWKLVVQNYSECYHCAPVHPELVKLSPATSGENDLVSGPFLGGFMTIAQEGGSLTESGRACGAPVGELPAEDHRRVYYYSLFPNVLLSLHPDYVMCHTLWPQGPARTRIVCEWLFHPDTLDPSSGFDPDDGVRFWDATNRQDWHVCELSQRGVSSRAYRPGPYSRRESLSVAFDRQVLEALRG
ncbi:MAG TPA: RHO alpha subunit C-terminal catalytic domain-containing protein, partial [Gemmatimonadaceae bacterium]|nr:RHO alpha subunit C-terminal catalytic domain-containing protein [Gemmatimonadaceae bacterium]